MPPEILIEYTKNKIIYTKKVDVWSLGKMMSLLWDKYVKVTKTEELKLLLEKMLRYKCKERAKI